MPKLTGKSKKINIAIIVMALLVVVGLGGAGYMYRENAKLKKDINTTKQKSPEDLNKELIAKVGNLIILPAEEAPTILTVDDKTKLKDQPFLQSAENGDRVFVFTKAKKAIIYRESLNKIVDAGTVSIAADQQAGAPAQANTPEGAVQDEPATNPLAPEAGAGVTAQ